MGIKITIVLIILLIIVVVIMFGAILELMEKVEKFAKSIQEHISLLNRYEKDIKKLKDNNNCKIAELEYENKSYKKVLENLQEEVDVLIDEKREVEGKTKELKKQLEDENFNLSTITNALGRVIGDKKSTDLARETSSNFEFILKAIHEIEKERKTLFSILGEYDSEKNEYALQNNYNDLNSMIDTVEKKIKEIFKEFSSEEELSEYEECCYESIPWALERIRLNMRQIELEKEQIKSEMIGHGKEAESISRLESYDFTAVMKE